MFTKNHNIHFKIINYWLSFVLFLTIISNLPHQRVPFFSWFNCSIYFLVFLQSVFLVKQDKNNKFVFVNIALFSLFHSLSFTNIFIGEDFLIEDNYLRYFLFEYKHIILSFLPALCIVYVSLKYLLKGMRSYKLYALSLLIILPIFLWNYYPFLLDKELILEIDDAVLYERVMLFDILPLCFLILYGFLLYRHDWSLGEHINTLMVCFFIITMMDITNLYGNISHITVFRYTQYVLMVNLSFLLITMFRLVNHSYSVFGQFYDTIVSSGNSFGVPIKRKQTVSYAIWQLTKSYFLQWRNAIGFSMLVIALAINFSGAGLFVKINMAVLSFGLVVLLYYLTALYEKRTSSGNIIKIKRSLRNNSVVQNNKILEG